MSAALALVLQSWIYRLVQASASAAIPGSARSPLLPRAKFLPGPSVPRFSLFSDSCSDSCHFSSLSNFMAGLSSSEDLNHQVLFAPPAALAKAPLAPS